jgi:hypothetical protein
MAIDYEMMLDLLREYKCKLDARIIVLEKVEAKRQERARKRLAKEQPQTASAGGMSD